MKTPVDKASESKSQVQINGPAQPKHETEGLAQFKDNRPETAQLQRLQGMANDFVSQTPLPVQKKKNDTGLPDNLKSGIENLSGISMDDVKVHRNSNKPAQLNAHAYAQGSEIHLASGQDKHLPHEAWHVVQQKQGRVKPTLQMKGKVNVNDDPSLEKEADVMGRKSLQFSKGKNLMVTNTNNGPSIELNTIKRNSASSLRVLQAKNFPANVGPLGFDIFYSIDPMQNSDHGGFEPTGPDVLQRLIVVDDDLDASRLMAAVRIYHKHAPNERITTIHKAKDVDIEEGEKIYMVAHGAGDDHGGRSAEDLATILKTWKLHEKSNVIKLISCFSGKDAPEWSYANELALELGFMYKVVGIKGLEATDEQGHTRATEQLVDNKTFETAYFGTLDGDDSFEKAEIIAQALKLKIATCELGEEVPLMLEAYEKVNELCQGVFKKLEIALAGMTRDKNKRDSEDVMTSL